MKKVTNYLNTVWRSIIGRTGKDVDRLSDILDDVTAGIIKLTLENNRLKARIEELEAKPKALRKMAEPKASTAKKKKRPTKSE